MTTTPDYEITDEEMADLVKMPYLAQSYQIVSLITRLREAEKDAARYRWLRKNSVSVIAGENVEVLWESKNELYGADDYSLDIEVDTAMQAAK